MKVIITESQFLNLIQRDIDEDYPLSWNIEEFKNLKSFNKRIKYCEQNLQRISSGTSRIVYKIDETKVLKLAKNEKGVAQNKTEINFSEDYLWDMVVAKLFDYDEDGLWVEMELARKVTTSIWNNIVGIPIDIFRDGTRFMEQQKGSLKTLYRLKEPERMEELYENDFTSTILDLIANYDVGSGDFGKLSTYGLVNRDGKDEIVIIDYGLTNEVYDSYYK
jgi:mRNA-degrading endonuclease RelE of RelBE toxin-antitoxin system